MSDPYTKAPADHPRGATKNARLENAADS